MVRPPAKAPQRQDVTFCHAVVTPYIFFMLACTRLTRRVCCPRPSWHTAHSAARFSLILYNYSSVAPNPPANENEDDDKESKARNDEPFRDVPYGEFKRTVGEGYRHASTRNWLGGEVVEFVFAWPSRGPY